MSEDPAPAVFSLAAYFPLGIDQQQALLLGQLAVAGAVLPGGRRGLRRAAAQHLPSEADLAGIDLDDYLDKVSSGRAGWQDALAGPAESLAGDSDLILVGIDLSTNPLLYGSDASPGIVRRRIDAVLDVFEADFSCVDAQQAYEEIVAELSGGKAGGWRSVVNSPITDVVAGIHPLLGLPTIFGLKALAGSGSGSVPANAAVMAELARVVHACRFAFTGSAQLTTASRARGQLLSEWSSRADTDGRIAAATLAALSELAGNAIDDSAKPDTTGMRLSDALRALRAMGVSVVVEDDIKPNGTARTQWQEDNWIVVEQQLDDASVRLLVRKRLDPHRRQ